MKKRILSLLLVCVMCMSLVPVTFAATNEAISAANELYAAGLFMGTGTDGNGNPIFDLDRKPNRNEAVTMLVRLLGKEEEAKKGSWSIPFTDVAEWAKPYIGYAYANGLTSGTSATTYGGEQAVTAAQYITFVLRSLGYADGADFQWDKAWELSDKIGLTNGQYNENTALFTRGDVAIISLQKLSTPQKGSATGEPTNSTESPAKKYPEGEYRVGTDIPAGEYRFTPMSNSRPGFYFVYSDSSKSNTVGSESFRGTAYYTVKEGQLLRVSFATFEFVAPNKTPSQNVDSEVLDEGEYRIGIDIPSGEYRFTPKSDSRPGFYFVYSDSSKSNTVGSESFRGTAYYTVKEGQLLRVNFATFKLIAESNPGTSDNPGSDTSVPVGQFTYYSGTSVPTFPSVIRYYGTHTPGNGTKDPGNADRYIYKDISRTDAELYCDALQRAFGFIPDKNDIEELFMRVFISANSDYIVLVDYLDFKKELWVIVDAAGLGNPLP